MINLALSYLKSNENQFIQDLSNCLAIASISTLSKHKKDMKTCVNFLVKHLDYIGLNNIQTFEFVSNPIIYADYLVDPSLPTLLFYGHYDVQPVDPIDEWTTAPFSPTIRDGYIYARGASDNKGMFYAHLKAIECYLKTSKTLPVNVKLVIEGEEEIGSNGLFKMIKQHKKLLSHDAIVVSDSPMFSSKQPSVCTSFRGLIYLEFNIQSMNFDVHSGQLGGAVPNIIHYISTIIASLKDPKTNRVLIPGFYDNVEPPPEFDASSTIAKQHINDLDAHYNLGTHANQALYNNIWFLPTLDCNGIQSGFVDEGAKTVIPNKLLLKLSCRLVANQNPNKISKLVQTHIQSQLPKSFNVTINDFNTIAAPINIDQSSIYVKKAIQALKDTHQKDILVQGEGGSIPILAEFQHVFKTPMALIGLNAPNDNIHAPNERFKISHYMNGIEAFIRYLHHLS